MRYEEPVQVRRIPALKLVHEAIPIKNVITYTVASQTICSMIFLSVCYSLFSLILPKDFGRKVNPNPICSIWSYANGRNYVGRNIEGIHTYTYIYIYIYIWHVSWQNGICYISLHIIHALFTLSMSHTHIYVYIQSIWDEPNNKQYYLCNIGSIGFGICQNSIQKYNMTIWYCPSLPLPAP